METGRARARRTSCWRRRSASAEAAGDGGLRGHATIVRLLADGVDRSEGMVGGGARRARTRDPGLRGARRRPRARPGVAAQGRRALDALAVRRGRRRVRARDRARAARRRRLGGGRVPRAVHGLGRVRPGAGRRGRGALRADPRRGEGQPAGGGAGAAVPRRDARDAGPLRRGARAGRRGHGRSWRTWACGCARRSSRRRRRSWSGSPATPRRPSGRSGRASTCSRSSASRDSCPPRRALLAHEMLDQGRDEDAAAFIAASEAAVAEDDLATQILLQSARGRALRAGAASWREAEARCRDAVRLAEETDDVNMHGDVLLHLAEVLRAAGDAAGGRRRAASALARSTGRRATSRRRRRCRDGRRDRAGDRVRPRDPGADQHAGRAVPLGPGIVQRRRPAAVLLEPRADRDVTRRRRGGGARARGRPRARGVPPPPDPRWRTRTTASGSRWGSRRSDTRPSTAPCSPSGAIPPARPGRGGRSEELTFEQARPFAGRGLPPRAGGQRRGDGRTVRRLPRDGAGRTTNGRFFAGRVEGRLAGLCELYLVDGVAQIEHVDTLAEYRGRGIARSVISRAVAEARAGRRRPRADRGRPGRLAEELYRRLGFDEIARSWSFTRAPVG